MRMKKDGHIKFYTKQEFMKLGKNEGLYEKESFMTSIRFPKKKDEAKELEEILKRHDLKIVESYSMNIGENDIYLTEKVVNILFQKK
ncbi:MAG TPA: hypothetical protein DG753_02535 [Clostridium sp.]|nr:hypothetical protein [Clostridium sp.]